MKKYIILLLLLLIASPAWAMRSIFFTSSTPSTSAVNFTNLTQGAYVATSDSSVRNVSSVEGFFESLKVNASVAPGSGKSYTITIQKNGSDTAITCQIADTATTCKDFNNISAIAVGDNFSAKVTPSGTPASSVIAISIIFNTRSNPYTLISLGGSTASGQTPSVSASEDTTLMGSSTWSSAGSQIAPTAGTISNLYILLNAAPGAAASGKSYTFTVLKNSVATALTCTVLETATSCEDTSNSVTFVAGDRLLLRSVSPANTPTAARVAAGYKFTPTINGESMYMWATGNSATSASATNYIRVVQSKGGFTATESAVQFVVPISGPIAKKIRASISNSPGTSKSFTYYFRKNSANTTLTMTISNSGTTASDSTHTEELTEGDLINWSITPSGTPTVGVGNAFSTVIYISPNDLIYGGTFYDSKIY